MGEGREGEEGKKEVREGEVERLHPKFHLNVFIVSASGSQKPQFWAYLTFGGLLYRPPLTDKGQIWCAMVDP